MTQMANIPVHILMHLQACRTRFTKIYPIQTSELLTTMVPLQYSERQFNKILQVQIYLIHNSLLALQA